jgi:cobalt/nickel transport system permease protein
MLPLSANPLPLLAMHMDNALLSPPVALVLILIAGGFVAWSAHRAGRQADATRVPLMGVMGAFVFAAQMINFQILPGTSGHLGGGVLLTILLGPHAATLVMSSILIVQCLIFQDGGLLALGANIVNLGIVPCYLGFAVFRLVSGSAPRSGRLYAGVFVATLIGMIAGAALVPLEVWASGVMAVPLGRFLIAMIGLHLLIALAEAIITFLVIVYVNKVRPQALGALPPQFVPSTGALTYKEMAASFLVVALLLAGLVSLWASSYPDALEAIAGEPAAAHQEYVKPNPYAFIDTVTDWQERAAPLPDYKWTSFSGLLGTVVTLLAVWVIARRLHRTSRRRPR